MAEGSRGRRWRWTVKEGDGGLRAAGLIERDTDGRFARLELATAAGILTFHPSGDGATAHGNVIRADSVDPIKVAWLPGASIAIEGDPFGSALGRGDSGQGWWVSRDLVLRRGSSEGLALDERGVPVLDDAAEWALETD